MYHWARAAVAMAIGFWAAFIASGAVAVFVFDYFEGAWGRWASLQVYVWIATLLASVMLFFSGAGFRIGARLGKSPGALVAGAIGILLVPVTWLISLLLPFHGEYRSLLMGVVLSVLSFSAAFLTSVMVTRARQRAV